ncbi:MAG TPA: sulfotransferase [Patescibacteria group bacterium]|nr:sulfotransferase [Patescibacteria group bacterium]
MKAPLNPAPTLLQTLRRDAIAHLTHGRFAQGIELLEQAAAMSPSSGELQNDLGTAHWQAGAPEKAEQHYKKALQLAPKNAYVLNSYGAFQLEQGKHDEAAKALARALQLTPDNAEVLNNLGLLAYRRGDMAEAEKFFIAAIRRARKWPNPHANIGNVMRDTRRGELAERAYRQALTLAPGHAQAWRDLGALYATSGRYADATQALEKATVLHPQLQVAWSDLLEIYEKTNQMAASAETIARARAQFADSAVIGFHEARLLRRKGDAAAARTLLERVATGLLTDAPENAPIFYELGQIYDRENNAAKAFEAFTTANRCKAKTAPAHLRPDIFPILAARLQEKFASGMIAGPLPEGDNADPVFLVGFPRSGTTLLDQILASHPSVAVSEEQPAVDKMIHYVVKKFGSAGPNDPPLGDAAYPDALPRLTAEDIAEMRVRFFAAHGGSPAKPVFVDKLPLNILHAGLIRRVFPRAKFILALRHPCDSVLSCFMQDFDLNSAMLRFCDLEESARFYDEAFSLWAHYARVLPLDVHMIRYEDVVADFRPTVASLLQFLGLPWDDAVLEYDKTARAKPVIHTPSYHQVTEKIYTRASGRWLRYREQLEPVFGILRPHALAHGYKMDEA